MNEFLSLVSTTEPVNKITDLFVGMVARLFVYVANEQLKMYCCGDPEAELRGFCESMVVSPLEVEWQSRVPLVSDMTRFDCESQRVEIQNPSGGVLPIGKRIEETTEAVFDGENKKIRVGCLAFVSDSRVLFRDEKMFGCLHEQVEFELDVIPGATLGGKVPFRLAPPEI
ncbi:hypothetical protein OSB04_002131 [Centaurea solstitialis]|uniref:Uncharacterized protein n=1 Tax=Centaurea solstitialis TaxID=347529 RepID=A0AA38WT13_9ASTR|nr:hypothetical protein OSB04_002131 [Centaurea solstitialis]